MQILRQVRSICIDAMQQMIVIAAYSSPTVIINLISIYLKISQRVQHFKETLSLFFNSSRNDKPEIASTNRQRGVRVVAGIANSVDDVGDKKTEFSGGSLCDLDNKCIKDIKATEEINKFARQLSEQILDIAIKETSKYMKHQGIIQSKQDSTNMNKCVADSNNDEIDDDDFQESASCATLRRLKLQSVIDKKICIDQWQSLQYARKLFQNSQQDLVDKHLFVGRASSSSSPIFNSSTGDDVSSSLISNDSFTSSSSSSSLKSNINNTTDFIPAPQRPKSSASSNGKQQAYGKTLVLSVSPSGSLPLDILDDESCLYALDGNDLMQCKSAFHANKKLFDSSQRIIAIKNASNHTNCDHCNKLLYPIDKIELDFARTTINLHKNCFKCCECKTTLSLDSYNSINSNLYCRAHVKTAALKRPTIGVSKHEHPNYI